MTGVVFLDIHKAFDSVDHSILLEKVQFYGVADRELMWFKVLSYWRTTTMFNKWITYSLEYKPLSMEHAIKIYI